MAAEFGRFLVGPQDDGDRIPADDRPNAMLDVAIPVGAFLALRRDRIHVGRIQRGGLGDAGAPVPPQPASRAGRSREHCLDGGELRAASRPIRPSRRGQDPACVPFGPPLGVSSAIILVGPGLAGSVPRSWPSSNAPIALQLQAFFVHHVLPVHLFVQKFGMTTSVMSGNPNPWVAAGVPATAGLPDNARPGFPINRTCRPIAL